MTDATMTHTIYAVGHNMAGYLPESDVYYTDDHESARASLIEDLDRLGNDLFSWAEEHDCDDIPCPTYGDDCFWQRANDATIAMEEVNLTRPTDGNGGEYLTYVGHVAYWINVVDPTDLDIDAALPW